MLKFRLSSGLQFDSDLDKEREKGFKHFIEKCIPLMRFKLMTGGHNHAFNSKIKVKHCYFWDFGILEL